MDKNYSGNKKYSVAVVGATGLIGRKILGTLYKRRFPISEEFSRPKKAKAKKYRSAARG